MITDQKETERTIKLLRTYFEPHQKASAAITALSFAEAMVEANKAEQELLSIKMGGNKTIMG